MTPTGSLRFALLLGLTSLLASCSDQAAVPTAVGQLASDRVEIAFEVHARIFERGPAEGSDVDIDTVLFVLDTATVDAELRAAEARIREQAAALAELTNGTRPEVLAQASADLSGARDTVAFRERELDRLNALVERALVAPNAVDSARTALHEAQARLTATAARFDELSNGARPEVVERARSGLAAAQAEHDRLAVQRSRHFVTAAAAGRLDSYIFEAGEWAREGAVGAVLLTGPQPHASVFLPAELRAGLAVGDPVQVAIEGFDALLDGRVRWISSEAAFTPYFALTERDRGRLSFRAEIELDADLADTLSIGSDRRLPDGLPVEVTVR